MHFNILGELNMWVSKSGIIDLNSTGLKNTWFNGRVEDPIHIKLGRMLVNQKWLDSFPFSYYKVVPLSVLTILPCNLNRVMFLYWLTYFNSKTFELG